jgi:hypothetical protein
MVCMGFFVHCRAHLLGGCVGADGLFRCAVAEFPLRCRLQPTRIMRLCDFYYYHSEQEKEKEERREVREPKQKNKWKEAY